MQAQVVDHRRRRHFDGVAVFRQLPPLLLQLLFVRFLDELGQLRNCAGDDVGVVKVRDERGLHGRPVLVGYRRVGAEHRGRRRFHRSGEYREARSEEEELLLPLRVEPDDLALDREWRVVHHDRAGRVFFFLIVAAGVERPNEVFLLHAVLFGHPVRDRLVDQRRRVAVVRCFLCFELLEEELVLLVLLAQCVALFFAHVEEVRLARLVLREVEARQRDVEIGHPDVRDQRVQFREIPVAPDLIQRHVERLLLGLR